jgi:hypothetical protein
LELLYLWSGVCYEMGCIGESIRFVRQCFTFFEVTSEGRVETEMRVMLEVALRTWARNSLADVSITIKANELLSL